MTLLDMMYTAQGVCQFFGKQIDLSLEQFNNLMSVVNDEFYKEMVDGYLSGNGAEVDSRVGRAIEAFKYQANWSLGAAVTTRFGISGQSVTLVNATVYRYTDFFVSTNASDYPDKLTRVDIVTASEAVERMSNSITHPSTYYPIIYLDRGTAGSTDYGYLIPSGFTTLYATYLKKPTTPILVLSESQGIQSQSGTSTALDFDSMFHIDILKLLLKYLGVIVNNEFIVQYLEQQKMNTK